MNYFIELKNRFSILRQKSTLSLFPKIKIDTLPSKIFEYRDIIIDDSKEYKIFNKTINISEDINWHLDILNGELYEKKYSFAINI